MKLDTAAAEIGISLAAYKRLCRLFLDNTDRDIQTLHDALRAGDTGKISETAHHIKGAATNLDLEELADLAAEMRAHAEEDHERLEEVLSRLGDTYKEIKSELLEQL
ncbi:MAG TPA: Hpt domain-containing protein [Sediminispirochaeta sp.]|nr:Hpt domain-containing protein [Sediminispirochaeta sp.]